MTKTEYISLITEQYFSVCANKTVLEIGPLDGIHTKIIGDCTSKLILIEPDTNQFDNLKKIPSVTEIITDDANFVLEKPLPSDVVVCCGILYHLHSPLHLLELIVNNCNPQYVILDSVEQYVNSPDYKPYNNEELNVKGYRFTRPNWKGIKLNQSTPFEIINQSMNFLGYKLNQKDNLNLSDWDEKSASWMALWEKH
jgi:hypothetical protein